jgi:hypothetical protein
MEVQVTPQEARQIDQAIRLLRDRHYRNYANAKDQSSETAKEQYRIYQQLDELRGRFF